MYVYTYEYEFSVMSLLYFALQTTHLCKRLHEPYWLAHALLGWVSVIMYNKDTKEKSK
jgi:hypothetical protein